jgi:hypothetical protein
VSADPNEWVVPCSDPPHVLIVELIDAARKPCGCLARVPPMITFGATNPSFCRPNFEENRSPGIWKNVILEAPSPTPYNPIC